MIVQLWGVRGSLPTPLENSEYRIRLEEILSHAIDKKLSSKADIDKFISGLAPDLQNIYGGNTTCATVTSKSGKLYIIDCGTGIRPLGDKLIQKNPFTKKAEYNIFITHTHWDHIQGLPFFKPLYSKNNTFNFHSALKDLHKRLKYQQEFSFFPKGFDEMEALKKFKTIHKGQVLELEDDLTVECYPLRHPGGCVAYKFTEGDKTFIFATDVEFSGSDLEKNHPEQDAFFRDTDLLILDSQYTLDEAFMKFDWGHTSFTMATNFGIHWQIKKLVLTHHEPSYADAKLSKLHNRAINHRNAMETEQPEILLAQEGDVFEL
jgi:phosphoribosyl 1,2-cyclic phosphodiesterase